MNHTRSKPIRPCNRYATCLACSISWFVSVHLPFLPISTVHPSRFPPERVEGADGPGKLTKLLHITRAFNRMNLRGIEIMLQSPLADHVPTHEPVHLSALRSHSGFRSVNPAHGQADGTSRAIQAMMRFTTFRCRSGESSTPRGTLHHLFRHPRQQVAVACCAVKTGCPRIGVWRPSFGGQAGASRCRTKSSAWQRRTSRPCFPM